MFAKLANNRRLEEATSAKDDVAPSKRMAERLLLITMIGRASYL